MAIPISGTTEILENTPDTGNEPISFDETVRRALSFCESLPDDFAPCVRQLAELQTRLSKGRLHLAILGQFNRGKSTFINALLRIRALPTSVLPLTSVPTVIEHGAERTCRIRFLDGREELTVKGAAQEIEKTLRQYVAEEHNPENRLKVKEAVISCPSDLLANGTVLIDTPGFGSTHLHNTQTTLDLLNECDAALFLLSADPPMTQTEMEFLRLVKERIPRLFFILNKVDLLSAGELDEVDRFIRGILAKDLGFLGEASSLFRTCAVMAERASAGEAGGEAWAKSGMAAVKKEILDFMVREKYFTLSEALGGKYKEIVASVHAQLEQRRDGIVAPISAAQQEIAAATAAIQSISLELESRAKRCAEEKDALAAEINSQTQSDATLCATDMKKALADMLDGRYVPDEAASVAAAVLPKHAADHCAKLLDAVVKSANKTLRTLVISQAAALENLQKRHAELLSGKAKPPQDTEKFIELVEISPPDASAVFDTAAWEMPQPQISDIFKKKAARLNAIRDFYEPLCAQRAAVNAGKAAKQAALLIDAAWARMLAEIRNEYKEMMDSLREIHDVKQAGVARMKERGRAEAAWLKDKLRDCPKA